jgi:hypothetical protein
MAQPSAIVVYDIAGRALATRAANLGITEWKIAVAITNLLQFPGVRPDDAEHDHFSAAKMQ